MAKEFYTYEPGWYQHSTVFPYGDWFNGSTWLLTPGEDFPQSVPAFRSLMYRMAREFGLRLRTRMTSEGLAVQALAMDGSILEPSPDSGPSGP
jgi:hypothetical protein